MKKERQEIIANLIGENEIGTQEELLALLIERGMNVTQATVSRDIKEMRIVKRSDANGKYRYYLPADGADGETQRLYDLIIGAAQSSEVVKNVILVHCLPGTASMVGSAADQLNCRYIAGTVAGDDTVLALCYSDEDAVAAKAVLDEMLGLE